MIGFFRLDGAGKRHRPSQGVAFVLHRHRKTEGSIMHTAPILQYLKKHGQLLDLEISKATGIPLAKVRTSLSELSALGAISRCSVTRYDNGKTIEAMQCRISGYVPPASPGRKAGAKN
jgi:transcription initiation factor IIE alpha subunit